MVKVIHHFPYWLPVTMGWIYNQVRFSENTDVENTVLCRIYDPNTNFPWNRIIETKSRFPVSSNLDLIQRKLGLQMEGLLKKIVAHNHTDIVHSHFGHVGWEDHPALRKTDCKHVVTVYGNDISLLPVQKPKWKKRYADFFSSVDAVLCEGEHMRDQVIALGGIPEKTHVQHLGVVLDDLHFVKKELSSGKLKVLMAAGFRQKKGLPDAIRALGILKKKGISMEIGLVGSELNEERSRLETVRIEDAIKETGLKNEITRFGFLSPSKFHEVAGNYEVFLSPSRVADDGDTEGGAPVALLEMAALGLVVVSTFHCDIPNMLPHNECALLSDERNVEGIAENLIRLIDEPTLFDRLAHNARNHVESEYDAKTQGGKLAQFYRGLVG